MNPCSTFCVSYRGLRDRTNVTAVTIDFPFFTDQIVIYRGVVVYVTIGGVDTKWQERYEPAVKQTRNEIDEDRGIRAGTWIRFGYDGNPLMFIR